MGRAAIWEEGSSRRARVLGGWQVRSVRSFGLNPLVDLFEGLWHCPHREQLARRAQFSMCSNSVELARRHTARRGNPRQDRLGLCIQRLTHIVQHNAKIGSQVSFYARLRRVLQAHLTHCCALEATSSACTVSNENALCHTDGRSCGFQPSAAPLGVVHHASTRASCT